MNSEQKLIRYQAPNWINKVNFDHLEKIAALGYTPENCAMYFDIPKAEFMHIFMQFESPLAYHYERGIILHKAKEGMTMLEDAESGENITNAQRLDRLRREIEFKNIGDEIYGNI